MAVSEKTKKIVDEFGKEQGHLFVGIHVHYTSNAENEIYIAFEAADVLALSRITKLMQSISDSARLRLGSELKTDCPLVADKIVLHIY